MLDSSLARFAIIAAGCYWAARWCLRDFCCQLPVSCPYRCCWMKFQWCSSYHWRYRQSIPHACDSRPSGRPQLLRLSVFSYFLSAWFHDTPELSALLPVVGRNILFRCGVISVANQLWAMGRFTWICDGKEPMYFAENQRPLNKAISSAVLHMA